MPDIDRKSSPFQFRLMHLMIAVTLVALVLGFGGWLDYFLGAAVYCVVPTILVTAAFYGRRDYQAFGIGGLVPWILFAAFRSPAISGMLSAAFSLIVLSGICGAAAVAVRRWLAPDQLDL